MRSLIPQFISITLLIMMAATVSSAADVAGYQRRVDSARAGIGVLLDNVSQAEIGEQPTQPDAEVYAELRRLVPNSEKIETVTGIVESNNQWFVDGLKAAESEKDLAKRAVILSELDQRLGAVSSKLDDLQSALRAERSKDEDKRKLTEILNRPEYQRPEKEPEKNSESESWVKQFLEWLESFFPKFSSPEGATDGTSVFAGLLQWVLIIAVILVLGFVLYKLLPLFAPRLRRTEPEKREERVILGEKIREDQSADDLFSEAERLAREGDIRGAIRKGYVALLCEMNDRKLIGLARHKTNRDYLLDVRTRRDIYDRMTGVTGQFERHWYGSQSARPADWEEFRNNCGETLKAI